MNDQNLKFYFIFLNDNLIKKNQISNLIQIELNLVNSVN